MSSADSARRLRILVIWSNQHFDLVLAPAFLRNPLWEVEIVSGGSEGDPGPYQAGFRRLWQLRQRLKNGEFDLVVSGVTIQMPWPRFKSRTTRILRTIRTFLTRRRLLLDTFWTPWLLSNLQDRVPMAVVDHLDPSFILPDDFPLLKACTLYFKLNLYHLPINTLQPLKALYGYRRVLPYLPRLRPYTAGIDCNSIPEKVRPFRERDIDILCTGSINRPPPEGRAVDPLQHHNTNYIRQDIYDRCRKLGGKYRVHAVDQPVPLEEYLELLRRSKMVVCTESIGCETARLYEVAAYASVPLINWPYTQNYQMLQPDVHAVYFSLIGDDFERVVEKALADPDQLAQIAQRGREHTIRYKDRAVLGQYVVDETLREFAAKSGAVSTGGPSR